MIARQPPKSKVEGVPLIVSGATDWTDIDVIFSTLDKVRERIRQNRNQEIFLCHKGGKHGAEMIAARWARARGVAQARFDPRWSAHGRAAPFKCNDEMLDDKFAATGVVLFGGNGVALNLGQKAEAKGLTVMRVADPTQKAAKEMNLRGSPSGGPFVVSRRCFLRTGFAISINCKYVKLISIVCAVVADHICYAGYNFVGSSSDALFPGTHQRDSIAHRRPIAVRPGERVGNVVSEKHSRTVSALWNQDAVE